MLRPQGLRGRGRLEFFNSEYTPQAVGQGAPFRVWQRRLASLCDYGLTTFPYISLNFYHLGNGDADSLHFPLGFLCDASLPRIEARNG